MDEIEILKESVRTLQAMIGAARSDGYDLAIESLRNYKPESEEVRCCLHSLEWAAWLEDKKCDILK